jgi:pyridoxal phosphate enzyme (YggS family)
VIDSADLGANLARVRSGVAEAARRAGRDPSEVALVAVAKGQPAAAIRLAAEAGVTEFGENYVNELAAKRDELSDLDGTGLRWHFVGALQSSTAHRVADLADVVHSVGSLHAAERLGTRAVRDGRRISALVQVDFTGSRNGVDPDDVGEAVEHLRGTDGLEVRGLMTLPPFTEDPEVARPYFVKLRELRDRAANGPGDLRELSMGMSGDYEVAVEEGATMVRIGTALFGPRPTE